MLIKEIVHGSRVSHRFRTATAWQKLFQKCNRRFEPVQKRTGSQPFEPAQTGLNRFAVLDGI